MALGAMLTLSILWGSQIELIEPEEAIKLIGDKDVVFISGDGADIYSINHIVGSVEMFAHHLHHADIMGDMHCTPLYTCPEEAQEYIRSKGIRNDQLIIAYDNFRGPNATGVYSFFESFGHKNIKLLNGGFNGIQAIDPNQIKYNELKDERKALKNEKKEIKDEIKLAELTKKDNELEAQMKALESKLLVQRGDEPKHEPSDYIIDLNALDTKHIAGKNEVKKAVDDILENGKESKFAIIDTRSMDEIIGERKMDNVARGGHIPGATFLEWSHITDMDNRKSFKSNEEMQKVFDKAGITKDQTIYAYCQVGTGRSSHIITALRLLGYENVKVFTGSWDAWGNDMDLPIRR
jgi:thiosulfate/3-mercaptopyruvate sulfurtransferase